jgi:hypothetical protein
MNAVPAVYGLLFREYNFVGIPLRTRISPKPLSELHTSRDPGVGECNRVDYPRSNHDTNTVRLIT